MTAAVRVENEIHPDDEMFRGNLDAYITVGRSALHVIESALASVGKTNAHTILDLPCGHGRVMRHIRAKWPSARIIACDLKRSGVDFCARKFAAVPVYSRIDPAEIPISEEFDVIWVGSLLTHLDRPLWRRFLDFLTEHLAADGLLVFTTCGRYVAHREQAVTAAAKAFARTGFGYYEPARSPGYGTAYASPEWVTRLLAEYPNRLIAYWERGWNDHQDAVVVSGERYDSTWRQPR
jgi:SAM-dependent methyltransferase